MKHKDLAKCVIGYGLILSVFLGSISLIQLRIDVKEIDIAEEDRERTVVQYYGLEDFYLPDSLDLNTRYGVIIDQKKYSAYYDVFESDSVPDIQVIKKE